jgi:hypothetical protein
MRTENLRNVTLEHFRYTDGLGLFTPGDGALGPPWMGWVGPRSGLGAVVKRNIFVAFHVLV